MTAASDSENGLVLFGVGDVGPLVDPDHFSIKSFSELIQSTMQFADVRIAQCERLYSTKGARQMFAKDSVSRLAPEKADLLSECGFDVVSLAGNHSTDYGEEALLDTIDLLRSKGIQTIGAGRNIEEARRPAIVEHNGVKVAVLAYCSIVREGDPATDDTAGIAPLRAHTFFEAIEYQPGTPPEIVTTPYAEDLEAMVSDIKEAKKVADAVVLWTHWGIHFIPRIIADYQETYARAAFAAGADLIIGHHAHIPKAVAVYEGKACFYSVGNFILAGNRRAITNAKIAKYGVNVEDARRAVIARAHVTKSGIDEVSFLPILIDEQARPEPLGRNDTRFDEAVQHIEWVSEGFPHQFEVHQSGKVIVRG